MLQNAMNQNQFRDFDFKGPRFLIDESATHSPTFSGRDDSILQTSGIIIIILFLVLTFLVCSFFASRNRVYERIQQYCCCYIENKIERSLSASSNPTAVYIIDVDDHTIYNDSERNRNEIATVENYIYAVQTIDIDEEQRGASYHSLVVDFIPSSPDDNNLSVLNNPVTLLQKPIFAENCQHLIE